MTCNEIIYLPAAVSNMLSTVWNLQVHQRLFNDDNKCGDDALIVVDGGATSTLTKPFDLFEKQSGYEVWHRRMAHSTNQNS